MASTDIKPEYSFQENGIEATFVLVIDGLKVERKMAKGFAKQPKNAIVLNQILNVQSINFALEMMTTKRHYRFHIQRLPSQINPELTKIKYERDQVVITLHKTNNDSWKPFVDSDFETIHLVNNATRG